MAELCADSILSDGGGSAIHASQSDLSIANSSPRLESNATSSTACMTEIQQRRDFSSDLICAICEQLFDRPVLVACGHSFCESCIEHRCRTNYDCIICQKDVGDLTAMIPSITLDNMVRKVKPQELENSFDDLYMCEEQAKSKVERSLSTRSRRRCFFSIAGPTVCSSPINPPRNKPLSPNAKPVKSSLKIPPDFSSFSINKSGSENTNEIDGKVFQRNGFGRRSERYTSSTQSRSTFVENVKKEDEEDVKMKRNSFLRRSLNAIRSRTPRHRSTIIQKIKEDDEEDEKLLTKESENSENDSKSHLKSSKSIWRRLFSSGGKKNSTNAKIYDRNVISHEVEHLLNDKYEETTTIAFHRLEDHSESSDGRDLVRVENPIGYYGGIGKKFERFAMRDEITVVVFGNSQSGKSTFVRKLKQIFLEPSERVRLISINERFSLSGINNLPYPEEDNRLPHFVSLVIKDENNCEKVIDIVDPEYDDSYLPLSYMKACDAAFFMIDVRNSSSLLSAHQIHRNIRVNCGYKDICFELIVNVRSDGGRVLSRSTCENMAKTMKTSFNELNVCDIERLKVEKLLLDVCERVNEVRRKNFVVKSQGILV